MLAYLQAVYPDAAAKDDLTYVARIQEWPRRVRELAERGWDVVSSVDDPALPPGSYRLGSLEQGQPRTRQAIKQRFRILSRDGWSCQDCGVSPRRQRSAVLQVHHAHQVQYGGGNQDDNLVTLCQSCHAGRHAVASELVVDELLNPSGYLGVAGLAAERKVVDELGDRLSE